MEKDDEIFVMRAEIQRLMETFARLAARAESLDENKAFDRVSIELDDVDRALWDAAFIRNDDRIEKLVSALEGASKGARAVQRQFEDLRDAVTMARQKVQAASAAFQDADAALGKAEEIVGLVLAP